MQHEIIKHSDDESVLAWTPNRFTHEADKLQMRNPVLARSPAYFADSGNIRRVTSTLRAPYTVTHQGLEIHGDCLSMVEGSETCWYLLLNCQKRRIDGGLWCRFPGRGEHKLEDINEDGEEDKGEELRKPDQCVLVLRSPYHGCSEGLFCRRHMVTVQAVKDHRMWALRARHKNKRIYPVL